VRRGPQCGKNRSSGPILAPNAASLGERQLTNTSLVLKDRRKETFMATQDVQGKDETKLANGGGAFPFWVSVVIVAGFFAVLFGIVYGVVQILA
jgi:hypothetical protein